VNPAVTLLGILVLFIGGATAQSRKISGFVFNGATEKPLKNVNIIIVGTPRALLPTTSEHSSLRSMIL